MEDRYCSQTKRYSHRNNLTGPITITMNNVSINKSVQFFELPVVRQNNNFMCTLIHRPKVSIVVVVSALARSKSFDLFPIAIPY